MIIYTTSRRIEPYRNAIETLYREEELQTLEEVNIYVFLVARTREADVYINPRFGAAHEVLYPEIQNRLQELNLNIRFSTGENLNQRRECWIGLKAIPLNAPNREGMLGVYASIVATFDYYLNGQLIV